MGDILSAAVERRDGTHSLCGECGETGMGSSLASCAGRECGREGGEEEERW